MFGLLYRFLIALGAIVAVGIAVIIYFGMALQLGWILTTAAAWGLLLVAPLVAAVFVRLSAKAF